MAAVAVHLDVDAESLRPAAVTAPRLQVCVLLIEDNEDSMWLVSYALQEFGNGQFALEWANNLNVGLDHLSRGGVDVVLLDLGLPESSGPESYVWVHEIAPKTPVVVLTGDSREETEVAVTACGAQGYLVKDNVSASTLLQAIQGALEAQKTQLGPRELTPGF